MDNIIKEIENLNWADGLIQVSNMREMYAMQINGVYVAFQNKRLWKKAGGAKQSLIEGISNVIHSYGYPRNFKEEPLQTLHKHLAELKRKYPEITEWKTLKEVSKAIAENLIKQGIVVIKKINE